MVRRRSSVICYTSRGYHAKHPLEARYFKRILATIRGDKGLRFAVTSTHVLTSMIREFAKELIATAIELCQTVKKYTLSSRAIQTAVRLTLRGELAKHAVSEGVRAVTKSCSSFNSGDEPPKKNAGLIIPPSYVKRQIKESSMTSMRIAKTACIYLAAVLEYLVSEILELASNVAIEHKKSIIVPRFIFLAVVNDQELDQVFNKPGTTFVQAGAMPNIIPQLMTKNAQPIQSF